MPHGSTLVFVDGDLPSAFDAIGAALDERYPGRPPAHWTHPGFGLLTGGLEAVVVCDAGDHWHLVTLGLVELWGADPREDAGFELSMRVRKGRGAADWALALLWRLGLDVADGTLTLGPGHTLDAGGPITGRRLGALRGLWFHPDPDLVPLATAAGRVSFLHAVGLTRGELGLVRMGSFELPRLAGADGRYVTDGRRRRTPR